ncbi:SpaA isopeptide-forming pilin-related protein, partial [Bacillus thuringiensis]|uniref:SpaA isopeptide-forming pilin-related protein n=1 Tax=Bacillus thuringiensis TaxID=1428 RepID=UPI003BFA6BF1
MDGSSVEGGMLKTVDMKGKDVGCDLSSDKDGKISGRKLRGGEYELIERKAPKDYDLNKRRISFTMERSEVTEAS